MQSPDKQKKKTTKQTDAMMSTFNYMCKLLEKYRIKIFKIT